MNVLFTILLGIEKYDFSAQEIDRIWINDLETFGLNFRLEIKYNHRKKNAIKVKSHFSISLKMYSLKLISSCVLSNYIVSAEWSCDTSGNLFKLDPRKGLGYLVGGFGSLSK